MNGISCPAREQLREYAAGRLSDETADSVAQHIEACPACQALLTTIDDADDTFVAQLHVPG